MAALAELSADRPGLVVPPGIPVREGRFSVGTLLDRLRGELSAVAGFATTLWVGPADASPPVVGPMPIRGSAHLSSKGRLFVDRRLRLWLDVADVALFDAVVLPADAGGIVIVPRERFFERVEALEW